MRVVPFKYNVTVKLYCVRCSRDDEVMAEPDMLRHDVQSNKYIAVPLDFEIPGEWVLNDAGLYCEDCVHLLGLRRT